MDDTDIKHLEGLILDFKESLEREMRTGFAELRTEIAELRPRLDTRSMRLERQGGTVQAGSRWSARMTEWSEKVYPALEQKDREIADLRDRMKRMADKL